MILGVPCLNRHDLLDKLIASALAGSRVPTEILIVDNSGSYQNTWESSRVRVVHSGRNLGVAASWNLLLKQGASIIANDDIELGRDTFANMAAALESGKPFVEVFRWALFGQLPSVAEAIGFYDEGFYPAYYEDNDYEIRLFRAGIPLHHVDDVGTKHVGWASSRDPDDPHGALRDPGEHRAWYARNLQYYTRKWGGPPGHETFASPFNRDGQDASRRKLIMRWDVLNHLAHRIGAQRYLEIGVSQGESMRNVRVAEKWGVDPVPTMSGVEACDLFFRSTSLSFFRKYSALGRTFPIDLIFIDGYHAADMVYREIEEAMPLLSSTGLIALHDVAPLTESMQYAAPTPGDWTGDVWKCVARLRREGKYDVRTIDTNFGVAIVKPRAATQRLDLPADAELTWELFSARKPDLLGVIGEDDLDEWLDSSGAGPRPELLEVASASPA